MMRSPDAAERTDPASEIDLRALGAALKRRRRAIVMPTLLAFVLVAIFVNVVTPRYTAETQVLLENQETFFTRPDRVNLPAEQINQLDQEAVASQVQLINSRDIARRAISELHLAGDPEFDPLAGGLNPLTRVLILLGATSDPTRESADSRIVTKFLEKLTVYSPPKTRVIAIQFTSRNADLAARAANLVAQLYLQEQSAAKRATAKLSADALAAQITDLRSKLTVADGDLERYRLESGLLAGSNNMTISGQQLADINSDLSKARTTQADAQAKAAMIRQLLRAGKAADVSDVINNDTVRRVSEQRVVAQAQLARESRTLLAGHPRIQELTAQVAEYDLALKLAAKQAAATLENEAGIAGQRVANLETVLTQQKKLAGVANTDEVHLRALERITQSFKDQLESSTAKYQEALARQSSTATPSDARIISGASRPQDPSFPKKIPFIVFGTVATLVFAVGFVIAAELLSGRADFEPEIMRVSPTSVRADEAPGRVFASKARQAWSFPEETLDKETRTEEAVAQEKPAEERVMDPVFAPVPPGPPPRPSADKLRMLASGGMLAATFAYIKSFGLSAAQSRQDISEAMDPELVGRRLKGQPASVGWETDDAVPHMPASNRPASADISGITDKIVAAHVPGRGLHVVGTALDDDKGPDVLIDLGRALSVKGRAIIVDLNRTPAKLAPLAAPHDEGRAKILAMHGLAELLSGDSTFAEVIHRDQGSRLHYIPTGLQEADFRDFDLILDALSETYDFIILVTPAFPQSEIAKVMAPYADFVVLAAMYEQGGRSIAEVESELIQAGAREVLIAGDVGVQPRQDVA